MASDLCDFCQERISESEEDLRINGTRELIGTIERQRTHLTAIAQLLNLPPDTEGGEVVEAVRGLSPPLAGEIKLGKPDGSWDVRPDAQGALWLCCNGMSIVALNTAFGSLARALREAGKG